jgi:hypothetical protein
MQYMGAGKVSAGDRRRGAGGSVKIELQLPCDLWIALSITAEGIGGGVEVVER